MTGKAGKRGASSDSPASGKKVPKTCSPAAGVRTWETGGVEAAIGLYQTPFRVPDSLSSKPGFLPSTLAPVKKARTPNKYSSNEI